MLCTRLRSVGAFFVRCCCGELIDLLKQDHVQHSSSLDGFQLNTWVPLLPLDTIAINALFLLARLEMGV